MQISIVLVAALSLLVAGVSAYSHDQCRCDCVSNGNGRVNGRDGGDQGQYPVDGQNYYDYNSYPNDYDYSAQTSSRVVTEMPTTKSAAPDAKSKSKDKRNDGLIKAKVGVNFNPLDPLGLFNPGGLFNQDGRLTNGEKKGLSLKAGVNL